MTRLSRDDAFRLIDQFDEYIHEQVGQDVTVRRTPEMFCVEFLGKKKRLPIKDRHPQPGGNMDCRAMGMECNGACQHCDPALYEPGGAQYRG